MKHTFLVRLAASGFRFGTLFLAISVAAVTVFGSSAALKQALKDSGAYGSAAKAAAGQASKTAGPNNSKAVNGAAMASFTPQSVQTTAEQNIDSIYTWLEGKSAKPDLRIDLRPYINAFNQNLGDQVSQRAATLPACSAEQLRSINLNTADILSLPCLPPGVDIASAKNQAIVQATVSNDFLQKPVLTTDSLPKDASGKSAIDQVAKAPEVYQWLTRAPLVLGTLAAVCAAAVLLLWRADWRHAVRKLARVLLGSGISVLLIVAAARLALWYAAKPDSMFGKMIAGSYRDVIMSFIRSLERAFDSVLLVSGIAYVTVAIVTIIIMRFLKPKPPAPELEAIKTPTTDDTSGLRAQAATSVSPSSPDTDRSPANTPTMTSL